MKRKQYLKHPRSWVLRTLGLEMVACFEDLLYHDDIDQAGVRARIDQLEARLHALGIVQNMRLHLEREVYETDSVICAEYVLGQLLVSSAEVLPTKEPVPSEKKVAPLIREFSSNNVGPLYVLETATMPERVKKFIVLQAIVNTAARFLDIEDGENSDALPG